MRILVDGDSCSKQRQIELLAAKHNTPVFIYCSYSHQIKSNYSKVFMSDDGCNRVDNIIYLNCMQDDIIITNDIGLASLCLLKTNNVLTNYGKILNKSNIDFELGKRNMSKQLLKKIKKPNKIKLYDKKYYSFYDNLNQLLDA